MARTLTRTIYVVIMVVILLLFWGLIMPATLRGTAILRSRLLIESNASSASIMMKSLTIKMAPEIVPNQFVWENIPNLRDQAEKN